MKKVEKILLPGITGTCFMTLFSYLLSIIKKEDFSEPKHLATMLHRVIPHTSKKVNQVAGWNAHFAVGLVFATAYVELWERGEIKPSVKNGLLLGAVSGLLAVAIWKLTFKLHPLPPWINYNKYYMQLVPAHVVFALFATLAYQLLKLQEEDMEVDRYEYI
ncbi:MAG: hypothetical protein JWQ84_551 [Mucilaginibacter sp.]|nr:hypothetical protein [Mucilaginibacter sp.]